MLKRLFTLTVAVSLVADPATAAAFSLLPTGITSAQRRLTRSQGLIQQQALVGRAVPNHGIMSRRLLPRTWFERGPFKRYIRAPKIAAGAAAVFAIVQAGTAWAAQTAVNTVAAVSTALPTPDLQTITAGVSNTVHYATLSYKHGSSMWSVLARLGAKFNQENMEALAAANDGAVKLVQTPRGQEWWLIDKGDGNLLRVPESLIDSIHSIIKPVIEHLPTLPRIDYPTHVLPNIPDATQFDPSLFSMYGPLIGVGLGLGALILGGFYLAYRAYAARSARREEATTSPEAPAHVPASISVAPVSPADSKPARRGRLASVPAMLVEKESPADLGPTNSQSTKSRGGGVWNRRGGRPIPATWSGNRQSGTPKTAPTVKPVTPTLIAAPATTPPTVGNLISEEVTAVSATTPESSATMPVVSQESASPDARPVAGSNQSHKRLPFRLVVRRLISAVKRLKWPTAGAEPANENISAPAPLPVTHPERSEESVEQVSAAMATASPRPVLVRSRTRGFKISKKEKDRIRRQAIQPADAPSAEPGADQGNSTLEEVTAVIAPTSEARPAEPVVSPVPASPAAPEAPAQAVAVPKVEPDPAVASSRRRMVPPVSQPEPAALTPTVETVPVPEIADAAPGAVQAPPQTPLRWMVARIKDVFNLLAEPSYRIPSSRDDSVKGANPEVAASRAPASTIAEPSADEKPVSVPSLPVETVNEVLAHTPDAETTVPAIEARGNSDVSAASSSANDEPITSAPGSATSNDDNADITPEVTRRPSRTAPSKISKSDKQAIVARQTPKSQAPIQILWARSLALLNRKAAETEEDRQNLTGDVLAFHPSSKSKSGKVILVSAVPERKPRGSVVPFAPANLGSGAGNGSRMATPRRTSENWRDFMKSWTRARKGQPSTAATGAPAREDDSPGPHQVVVETVNPNEVISEIRQALGAPAVEVSIREDHVLVGRRNGRILWLHPIPNGHASVDHPVVIVSGDDVVEAVQSLPRLLGAGDAANAGLVLYRAGSQALIPIHVEANDLALGIPDPVIFERMTSEKQVQAIRQNIGPEAAERVGRLDNGEQIHLGSKNGRIVVVTVESNGAKEVLFAPGHEPEAQQAAKWLLTEGSVKAGNSSLVVYRQGSRGLVRVSGPSAVPIGADRSAQEILEQAQAPVSDEANIDSDTGANQAVAPTVQARKPSKMPRSALSRNQKMAIQAPMNLHFTEEKWDQFIESLRRTTQIPSIEVAAVETTDIPAIQKALGVDAAKTSTNSSARKVKAGGRIIMLIDVTPTGKSETPVVYVVPGKESAAAKAMPLLLGPGHPDNVNVSLYRGGKVPIQILFDLQVASRNEEPILFEPAKSDSDLPAIRRDVGMPAARYVDSLSDGERIHLGKSAGRIVVVVVQKAGVIEVIPAPDQPTQVVNTVQNAFGDSQSNRNMALVLYRQSGKGLEPVSTKPGPSSSPEKIVTEALSIDIYKDLVRRSRQVQGMVAMLATLLSVPQSAGSATVEPSSNIEIESVVKEAEQAAAALVRAAEKTSKSGLSKAQKNEIMKAVKAKQVELQGLLRVLQRSFAARTAPVPVVDPNDAKRDAAAAALRDLKQAVAEQKAATPAPKIPTVILLKNISNASAAAAARVIAANNPVQETRPGGNITVRNGTPGDKKAPVRNFRRERVMAEARRLPDVRRARPVAAVSAIPGPSSARENMKPELKIWWMTDVAVAEGLAIAADRNKPDTTIKGVVTEEQGRSRTTETPVVATVIPKPTPALVKAVNAALPKSEKVTKKDPIVIVTEEKSGDVAATGTGSGIAVMTGYDAKDVKAVATKAIAGHELTLQAQPDMLAGTDGDYDGPSNKDAAVPADENKPAPVVTAPVVAQIEAPMTATVEPATPAIVDAAPDAPAKRGFWGRLKGLKDRIFGSDTAPTADTSILGLRDTPPATESAQPVVQREKPIKRAVPGSPLSGPRWPNMMAGTDAPADGRSSSRIQLPPDSIPGELGRAAALSIQGVNVAARREGADSLESVNSDAVVPSLLDVVVSPLLEALWPVRFDPLFTAQEAYRRQKAVAFLHATNADWQGGVLPFTDVNVRKTIAQARSAEERRLLREGYENQLPTPTLEERVVNHGQGTLQFGYDMEGMAMAVTTFLLENEQSPVLARVISREEPQADVRARRKQIEDARVSDRDLSPKFVKAYAPDQYIEKLDGFARQFNPITERRRLQAQLSQYKAEYEKSAQEWNRRATTARERAQLERLIPTIELKLAQFQASLHRKAAEELIDDLRALQKDVVAETDSRIALQAQFEQFVTLYADLRDKEWTSGARRQDLALLKPLLEKIDLQIKQIRFALTFREGREFADSLANYASTLGDKEINRASAEIAGLEQDYLRMWWDRWTLLPFDLTEEATLNHLLRRIDRSLFDLRVALDDIAKAPAPLELVSEVTHMATYIASGQMALPLKGSFDMTDVSAEARRRSVLEASGQGWFHFYDKESLDKIQDQMQANADTQPAAAENQNPKLSRGTKPEFAQSDEENVQELQVGQNRTDAREFLHQIKTFGRKFRFSAERTALQTELNDLRARAAARRAAWLKSAPESGSKLYRWFLRIDRHLYAYQTALNHAEAREFAAELQAFRARIASGAGRRTELQGDLNNRLIPRFDKMQNSWKQNVPPELDKGISPDVSDVSDLLDIPDLLARLQLELNLREAREFFLNDVSNFKAVLDSMGTDRNRFATLDAKLNAVEKNFSDLQKKWNGQHAEWNGLPEMREQVTSIYTTLLEYRMQVNTLKPNPRGWAWVKAGNWHTLIAHPIAKAFVVWTVGCAVILPMTRLVFATPPKMVEEAMKSTRGYRPLAVPVEIQHDGGIDTFMEPTRFANPLTNVDSSPQGIVFGLSGQDLAMYGAALVVTAIVLWYSVHALRQYLQRRDELKQFNEEVVAEILLMERMSAPTERGYLAARERLTALLENPAAHVATPAEVEKYRERGRAALHERLLDVADFELRRVQRAEEENLSELDLADVRASAHQALDRLVSLANQDPNAERAASFIPYANQISREIDHRDDRTSKVRKKPGLEKPEAQLSGWRRMRNSISTAYQRTAQWAPIRVGVFLINQVVVLPISLLAAALYVVFRIWDSLSNVISTATQKPRSRLANAGKEIKTGVSRHAGRVIDKVETFVEPQTPKYRAKVRVKDTASFNQQLDAELTRTFRAGNLYRQTRTGLLALLNISAHEELSDSFLAQVDLEISRMRRFERNVLLTGDQARQRFFTLLSAHLTGRDTDLPLSERLTDSFVRQFQAESERVSRLGLPAVSTPEEAAQRVHLLLTSPSPKLSPKQRKRFISIGAQKDDILAFLNSVEDRWRSGVLEKVVGQQIEAEILQLENDADVTLPAYVAAQARVLALIQSIPAGKFPTPLLNKVRDSVRDAWRQSFSHQIHAVINVLARGSDQTLNAYTASRDRITALLGDEAAQFFGPRELETLREKGREALSYRMHRLLDLYVVQLKASQASFEKANEVLGQLETLARQDPNEDREREFLSRVSEARKEFELIHRPMPEGASVVGAPVDPARNEDALATPVSPEALNRAIERNRRNDLPEDAAQRAKVIEIWINDARLTNDPVAISLLEAHHIDWRAPEVPVQRTWRHRLHEGFVKVMVAMKFEVRPKDGSLGTEASLPVTADVPVRVVLTPAFSVFERVPLIAIIQLAISGVINPVFAAGGDQLADLLRNSQAQAWAQEYLDAKQISWRERDIRFIKQLRDIQPALIGVDDTVPERWRDAASDLVSDSYQDGHGILDKDGAQLARLKNTRKTDHPQAVLILAYAGLYNAVQIARSLATLRYDISYGPSNGRESIKGWNQQVGRIQNELARLEVQVPGIGAAADLRAYLSMLQDRIHEAAKPFDRKPPRISNTDKLVKVRANRGAVAAAAAIVIGVVYRMLPVIVGILSLGAVSQGNLANSGYWHIGAFAAIPLGLATYRAIQNRNIQTLSRKVGTAA